LTKNCKSRFFENLYFTCNKLCFQTSVFTPGYGSVTKVRVTSQNDAQTVITKLFNKFRVENSPNDFSLYVVKETEGKNFPVFSVIICSVEM